MLMSRDRDVEILMLVGKGKKEEGGFSVLSPCSTGKGEIHTIVEKRRTIANYVAYIIS